MKHVPRGLWFCEFCTPEQPDPKDEDALSPNSRACEKHRKWKKRCPADCPMRARWKNARKKKMRGKAKRKLELSDENEEAKKQKVVPLSPTSSISSSSTRDPTYVEMIEEAIITLGGKATTPDITDYMEVNHGEVLANKTRTWRNSVSGTLSIHFSKLGRDAVGRTMWGPMKGKWKHKQLALMGNYLIILKECL